MVLFLPQHLQICDAVHIPTGALVALKLTDKSFHPHEAELMQYLSSEPLSSDPRNHCVQLLEVLDLPDEMGRSAQVLVMPWLRPFKSPTFDTVGEAVDCFRQLFEVINFYSHILLSPNPPIGTALSPWTSHCSSVCDFNSPHCMAIIFNFPHFRDLNINNFMMEWKNMFPKGFHPQNDLRTQNGRHSAPFFTRTQRPTRYIIIDFGMSSRYDPSDVSPREVSLIGGDKTVPEFLKGQPHHDPYKTDVYYVGNLIRTEFMLVRTSLLPTYLLTLSLRDTLSLPTFVDIKLSNLWDRSSTTWFKMIQPNAQVWVKLSNDLRNLFKVWLNGNFVPGLLRECYTSLKECRPLFTSFHTGRGR